MVIVYASRTRNVERFCSRIEKYLTVRVGEYNPSMGEFVLITYTDNQGAIPKVISDFLKDNYQNMVGVCSSGRIIWKMFGTYHKSSQVISSIYNVPILHQFEMSGNDEDIKILLERIEEIEQEKLY